MGRIVKIEIPQEDFGVHKFKKAEDAYELLEKVSSIHTAIAIGERNLNEYLIIGIVNSYTHSKYEELCGKSEPVNWNEIINDKSCIKHLLKFDFFLYNKYTKTYYVNKMCDETPIYEEREAILLEIWETYGLGFYAMDVVKRLDKFVSGVEDSQFHKIFESESDFREKAFYYLYTPTEA